VQATREWEGVVKSTAALITALRIGPLGAGNPADRLAAAKDAFARAQTDFNAHPSAAGAAAVQSAAQALLPLAESVLSKPSPAYQALFAGVIHFPTGYRARESSINRQCGAGHGRFPRCWSQCRQRTSAGRGGSERAGRSGQERLPAGEKAFDLLLLAPVD
jgi:hypothetical protein